MLIHGGEMLERDKHAEVTYIVNLLNLIMPFLGVTYIVINYISNSKSSQPDNALSWNAQVEAVSF